MKLIIEMNDDVARRVCPCEKNGKHDHKKCVQELIESGLLGGTYKRELEKMQQEFQQKFERPKLSVTTE